MREHGPPRGDEKHTDVILIADPFEDLPFDFAELVHQRAWRLDDEAPTKTCVELFKLGVVCGCRAHPVEGGHLERNPFVSLAELHEQVELARIACRER